MKLIFSDSHNISELDFKRLLLLGSEIIIVERASIQLYENIGTVGEASLLRNIESKINSNSIKLNITEPPTSTSNSYIYQKYFETDLANSEFKTIVLNHLTARTTNKQNTNTITKENFLEYVKHNIEEILHTDLFSLDSSNYKFNINSKNDALCEIKSILCSYSMRITELLEVAERTGGKPISINPVYNELITQRLSSNTYIGNRRETKSLGLKIIQSIIPDQALIRIKEEELIKFREKTNVHYKNWITEVNKIEAILQSQGFQMTNNDIDFIVNSEINPKINELEKELRAIRNDMFKNILKHLKDTTYAFITGGTLSNISIKAAIIGFILHTFKNTPKIIDSIIDHKYAKKEIEESNSLTYLLKAHNFIEK